MSRGKKSAAQRNKENKLKMREKRKHETTDEKQLRLERVKDSVRKARMEECPEKKRQRLGKVKESVKKSRIEEGPEKKQRRLEKVKESVEKARIEESPEKKKRRLEKVKESVEKARIEESPEKKQRRLRKGKESVKKARIDEGPEKKQNRKLKVQFSMTKLRHHRKSIIPSNQKVIEDFLTKVKDAADYVCCSCHRLMYRVSVVHMKPEKYTKAEKPILDAVLGHRRTSQNDEWICITCHNTLKRGKMPAQSKANNLTLENQPPELKNLTPLELRLVSQRIPFMKMVGLPRGRQHGIHGPAVNVPAKLDLVCQLFPRLPSQCQLLPLKFKRRRQYKSHYMYDYVDIERVLSALKWLQANNPHYHEISINQNWTTEAAADDEELWKAMTYNGDNSDVEVDKSNCDQPLLDSVPVDGNICKIEQGAFEKNLLNKKGSSNSMNEEERSTGVNNKALQKIATLLKMKVVDVPADGNCLFSAVCFHLQRLGIYTTPTILRKDVAFYMSGCPELYKDFVCNRMASDDLMNADTEQPTAEDQVVQLIDNRDTQKEVQWLRYLDGLEHGTQWGDHIVIQALADQYSLKIFVHTTNSDHIEQVYSRYRFDNEFHLGLIAQYHYVILVEQTEHERTIQAVECVEKSCSTASIVHIEKNVCEVTTNDICNEENEEILIQEDESAFEEISKIRGLPFETSMINDTPDVSGKVISVAPGEGEKPVPLLSDEHYEELANPDKYPDGTHALSADRPVKLHPRRYFNQRLLDCDGRFAKSVEYLLSAQYAVESKQVHGDINHFIYRRAPGKQFRGGNINAGLLKNVEHMNELIKADNVYKVLKNVRGSPGYFQTVFYDVLAMVRQLGIPTWFFTVSAADMQWPDVIQTIARQYGTVLTDNDVKNLSFAERSHWLRTNPVTAARQFQYRLELLFRDVLMSSASPLGEVVDFVQRIEFQARGSPHAHTLLWIKDAPKVNVQTDQEVCDFLDKYITCALPTDDADLFHLVENLQMHSHSSYCRKKGSCRFRYPRAPSCATILAREPDDVEQSTALKDNAKEVLMSVQKVLSDEQMEDDISLAELCDKSGTTENDYMQAVSVSQRGSNIVLKRTPLEKHVNAYNPTIIKAWKANIDIQFVLDAYACVMYVASYMTKDESGMGELLKQACKEHRDAEIKTKLRKVGSVFLNHREVSAQEAAYRILSMPLKKMSRAVVFVNTDAKSTRAVVLKTKEQLENLDNDDEDIFQKSLVDRYESRPNNLEQMCLAEFAANYTTDYKENDEVDDSVPIVLEEVEDLSNNWPKYIKLKDRKGTMHKRKRPAVIRFRKFSEEKEPSNFYRAKLMLYLPWRTEERDLINGHEDFKSHYDAVAEIILVNEVKYTENAEMIDHAIEENAENGPPRLVWELLAPGTEHANLQDQNEGVDVERHLEQEDIDANADMFQKPLCDNVADFTARYELEEQRETLAPREYRNMIRCLNDKQRQIVMYHRKWCKYAVGCLKQNKKPEPYRMFLSGPGGVGKSHVIRLIHSDTKKIFSLSRKFKPTDIVALLTAPTGVAAFNIGGMTVHSALLLRTSKYGKDGEPLTCEKLNTLRSKLENLQLLIIDEVSMVGSDMLLNIHRRLCEIMGPCDESVLFGNVSILAVGDLYQLPPVCQSHIYDPVKNAVANLYGSLWKDHFKVHELDEVMRQKNDKDFAELLCRVRLGKQNNEDLAILRSREVDKSDPDYPLDALHVFAYNCDVDEWNIKKLNEVEPDKQKRTYISAVDDKRDSTRLLNMQNVGKTTKRSETGGLHTVLELTLGARVMLIYNVDTSDGLVNGVIGIVEGIEKNVFGKVITVLVKFDDTNVGKRTIASGQWKDKYPNAVPIVRHEGKFEKSGKKGAQISRLQFPLTLAWAVTIHKCQGLTLEKIVVSMRGSKRFGPGQAYVAFSRVTSLEGLYITDFDAVGIRTNTKVAGEMSEMSGNISTSVSLKVPVLQDNYKITIGHLNIQYCIDKLKDMQCDEQKLTFDQTDIMCFTETYLTKDHCIDVFLNEHGYKPFRIDVPSTANHMGKHGIMICAASRLNPRELDLLSVQGLESKVILVDTERGRLVVAVIYRSPSTSLKIFMQHIESLLHLLPLNIPTVLIGDFNDNLFDCPESSLTILMGRYGFKQLVDKPTTDACTLVDHIYLNRQPVDDKVIHVDVCDIYYSDHDATFLTTNIV